MKRDYSIECRERVAFIQRVLQESGLAGIVFGNSGGKDSALVGALCKSACSNTVGVILPCGSKRNFSQDMEDAKRIAKHFQIETRIADLTPARDALIKNLTESTILNQAALNNIAPRLRMTSLYAIGAAEGMLVAGTGNRSEAYVGYYTKWGDGAHDFNPISDLTATEVIEFLDYLNAPDFILKKAPSAALYDGQTDEMELGFSYAVLDAYLHGEEIPEEIRAKIERMHAACAHKRRGILHYREVEERDHLENI